MALFTDQLVSSVSDLVAYESNLPEIAAAEDIDLNAKLQLAHTEVGAQLEAVSKRPGSIYFVKGAGWQSTGGEANLSRFDLSQVVVTPPLKLLHAFQTLAIIYRDAYNRKLNDKYLPKWQEYKELAKWSSDLLRQTGIGIAISPVPRPPKPTLDWVPSTLPAAALFVRMTWVNEKNIEGAGSEEQAVTVPDSNALQIVPPEAPAGITGWNVYVGESSGELTQQNQVLLNIGSTWEMPATGLVAGSRLGNGQTADFFKTVPRFLQRG